MLGHREQQRPRVTGPERGVLTQEAAAYSLSTNMQDSVFPCAPSQRSAVLLSNKPMSEHQMSTSDTHTSVVLGCFRLCS